MGDTAPHQLEPPAGLDAIVKAAREGAAGGLPPVERWDPSHCGDIGLEIRRDGSWWYQGSRIHRQPLVRLFSTILRKDDDGRHYLVTPAEKVVVAVEVAPFLGVRLDADGDGADRAVFITTNVGDVAEVSAERPLWMQDDPDGGPPRPFVRVRGRLDAALTRAAYFDLVALAEERRSAEGPVLGVWSAGVFFPLAEPGGHLA